jgi:hypothetical protein
MTWRKTNAVALLDALISRFPALREICIYTASGFKKCPWKGEPSEVHRKEERRGGVLVICKVGVLPCLALFLAGSGAAACCLK